MLVKVFSTPFLPCSKKGNDLPPSPQESMVKDYVYLPLNIVKQEICTSGKFMLIRAGRVAPHKFSTHFLIMDFIIFQ